MMEKVEAYDEQCLWNSMKSGGEAAFLDFYEYFYQHLYNYGLKLSRDKELTKDVLQELFLDIWQNRKKQSNVHFVRAYLFTTLRRRILKALDLKEIPTDAFSDHQVDIALSREHLLMDEEFAHLITVKLNKALDSLTKRQREIIHLKFYEMLGYEEISEIMSLQYQSVVNHAHEAIKALRSVITSLILVAGSAASIVLKYWQSIF
jgi:RNA polymerase sigma factor (sigma-70 family)